MRVIARAVRRLGREDGGFALVFALMASTVLGITAAALVLGGTANQSSSFRGSNDRHAFALAQTGLAYAEGMLYAAAASHTTPLSGVQDLPAQAGGGSGSYWASVAGDGVTWTMYGSGTYRGVSRQVSAQADVPSPVTTTQSGVWNYLYADTSGSTCSTDLQGNVTISVPIVVRGDLCIGGSLTFSGSQLEAGGSLTVSGSAKVGSAKAPISTLRVGLTSTSTSTCNGVMPGTGVCDGGHNPIYASSAAEGMDLTPQMPCIGQPSSLNPACTGSNDGTWSTLHTQYTTQAGLTKNGCPANLFDNDSTLNNSDTLISSVMFGSTAYDCEVGTNTIEWKPSTHTLTVNGTFYFDGSLTLSGTVIYSGQATFYTTGGIGTTGSPIFCGASSVVGGSSCTTSWSPDTDGIIMVAGCWADTTGATLITSNCVSLGGGSTVQFGVYCTTQYTTAGGASNMGPVLANSLSLGGGAQTLMPFHVFPPNTPLNTSTSYLPASTPVNWSG